MIAMMREIMVYMRDLKLFYLISKEFKENRVRWAPLDSFSDVPSRYCVVITTAEDLLRYQPKFPNTANILVVSRDFTAEEILILARQYQVSIKSFGEIIVSIDPGSQQTGIAVFLDKSLLYTKVIYQMSQLGKFLKRVFHAFGKNLITLKIGQGYPKLTRQFLSYCYRLDISNCNFHYLLVNEHLSSNSGWKRRWGRKFTRHEGAAIAIGYRPGVPISGDSHKYHVDLVEFESEAII